MKLRVSIPDHLCRAAERLAQRLGISRNRLIQRAVAEYVEAYRDDDVTRVLDEVHGSNGERAEVDRVLERLQSASLPTEDW